MYEVTVKWPDGRTFTEGEFSESVAVLWCELLWAAGADDAYMRCVCGTCETCTDRATFEG